ncbi:glycosyltransferase family 25 protein [Thalassovita sp.]|uniref:glycosyltransferase family 25 protein n=1 Tax=Thalassovita sp. TaxID=1979401 RepID=UPI0028829B41|nr:glycosyltransferase family 25 protein [Thalassovita sp.]MDF1802070.1 glycosyltransferase family 25 protein [Thalassovita sp.]
MENDTQIAQGLIGDSAEKIANASVLFASLVEQDKRRDVIRRNFGDVQEFAFVDCVDGRGWSEDETNAYLSDQMKSKRVEAAKQGKTWLASGAIACALTHRDNLIGNSTAPGKVLCEDDVVFEQEFLTHLEDGSALEQMAQADGFVMLNYRSRTPIKAEKTPVASFGKYSVHRLVSDHVASGAAYFVTPEVGRSIRDFQTPLQVPIDAWSEMKKAGVFKDIYLVVPSPARTGHFPSTMNYGRGSKSRLVEGLRNVALLRRLRWRLIEARKKTWTKVAEWV